MDIYDAIPAKNKRRRMKGERKDGPIKRETKQSGAFILVEAPLLEISLYFLLLFLLG